MTSDLKEEEFYDCDRIMYTNRKINYYDLNPTDELYPWKAFSPGANGEFYIKTVCAKLGHWVFKILDKKKQSHFHNIIQSK